MNAILGFAQLLESDPFEPLTASQKENVNEILKAGKHLLALINEVLDLSKIESGKIPLSIETVRVSTVIYSSTSLLQPMLDRYQVELKYSACDEYYVRADKTRLQQVMLNLISNAIKYNKKNGKVRIYCEKVDNNYLQISVEDNGIGIPKDKTGRIIQSIQSIGGKKRQ